MRRLLRYNGAIRLTSKIISNWHKWLIIEQFFTRSTVVKIRRQDCFWLSKFFYISERVMRVSTL
jgi:hypothetical protein